MSSAQSLTDPRHGGMGRCAMRARYAAPTATDLANPRPLVRLFARPEASPLWLALRLYVGWRWLYAGWHKLSGPESVGWVRDGSANGQAVHQGDKILAFWQKAIQPPAEGARPQVRDPFHPHVLPYTIDHDWAGPMSYVIAYGEFLVGLALILGFLTGLAALFGATMNFNYMLAGSASLNPVIFLGALLLVLAWRSAGYIGLDRWLLP